MTVTLTAGKYFMAGYTSETAAQLVEHITATMQADGNFSSDECTYAASTGKVTFQFDATTTVTFTDAALGVLLGFGSTQSGDNNYTGTTQARYVWRPQEQIAQYALLRSTVFEPVSSSVVSVSPDGTTYSTAGSTRYEAVDEPLSWEALPEADGPTPTTDTVYLDFEQFFEDVIAAGEQIRYYWDRDNNASGDFATVMATSGGGPGKPIGRLGQYLSRTSDAFDGLWDVSIPIVKQK